MVSVSKFSSDYYIQKKTTYGKQEKSEFKMKNCVLRCTIGQLSCLNYYSTFIKHFNV